MLSAGTIVLEYVCPFLGCMMANLMFSAPYKDVKAAVDRGYLGDLNPTPWGFMTGNCIGWVTYSFLIQNLFVFFANAPGFILSVWFNMCAAKLQYEQHRATEMRRSLIQFLENDEKQASIHFPPRDETAVTATTRDEEDASGEITTTTTENDGNHERPSSWQNKAVDWGKIVLQVTSQQSPAPAPHEKIVVSIVIAWLAIISILSFADVSKSTKKLIVGFCVNLNLLFFYGAPLSTIMTVLRTKSSASIHIRTMTTNTANGAFWMAYGLAVLDPFIYIPNGIGAALGVVQMFLIMSFPRRTTTTRNDIQHKGEQSNASLKETTVVVLEEPIAKTNEMAYNSNRDDDDVTV